MDWTNVTNRALRKHLQALLGGENFQAAMAAVSEIPGRRAVNPIIGLFCCRDELIRWRAVSAFGVAAAALADRDMESARVVLRRLMWTLNDESGGIGWGAPEAMGEAAALHERIACEYGGILVSYIREDCNFLEHPVLQRGVLWGVGRLVHARTESALGIGRFLVPFLSSSDPYHRGLAAWASRALDEAALEPHLERLTSDTAALVFYRNGALHPVTVGRMAAGDIP